MLLADRCNPECDPLAAKNCPIQEALREVAMTLSTESGECVPEVPAGPGMP